MKTVSRAGLALGVVCAAGLAQAQSFTCTVDDLQFEGTSDKEWHATALLREYTITPSAEAVLVSYMAPGSEESSDEEMVLVSEGVLSNVAASVAVFGLNVFAYPQDAATRTDAFPATHSVIADAFVNTWVLTCNS